MITIFKGYRVRASKKSFWIQRIRGGERFSYPRHTHESFAEIVYVDKGTTRQVVNGEHILTGAGTLLFIREHDVHSVEGSDCAYYNIQIQRSFLDFFFSQLPPDIYARSIVDKKVIRAQVSKERRAFIAGLLNELVCRYDSPAANIMFMKFMAIIFSGYFLITESDVCPDDAPPWMRRVTGLIAEDSGTATVRSIVKECGMTNAHITRSFKKHFGKTLSQYLLAARLQRARALIADGGRPIIDAAYDAGFGNIGYFYRMFKRHYGVPPGAYHGK